LMDLGFTNVEFLLNGGALPAISITLAFR